MKILITGGLGFIGHNVSLLLEQQGYEVVVADTKTNYGILSTDEINYLIQERQKKLKKSTLYNYDITHHKYMDWLFAGYNFDMVIHLASFPRQNIVDKNPMLASRVMSEGLITVLELTKKYKTKKFVYVSSSMVYGNFSNNVTEDHVCNPQGQYGILKLAGEHLVKNYAGKNNFDYTIIRPSAVYGPMDISDRVISKFFIAAMNDGILNVNGKEEILDFTYVTDTANGIVSAALSDNTNNKTYNVTKSKGHTLLQAANLIVNLVGKGTVNIKDRDIEYPSRGTLNIDSACKDFNYNPVVDIEEGLKKYYDYLKDSPFWSSKTI